MEFIFILFCLVPNFGSSGKEGDRQDLETLMSSLGFQIVWSLSFAGSAVYYCGKRAPFF